MRRRRNFVWREGWDMRKVSVDGGESDLLNDEGGDQFGDGWDGE